MTIIFSILRNLLLTVLLWFSQVIPPPAGLINPLAPLGAFDVFSVDQQSVSVPLLRLLTGTPVVFYCHFPDKLLSGGWDISEASEGAVDLKHGGGAQKVGLLKKIYRWPIDKLEEVTTGEALPCAALLMLRPGGRHPCQLQVLLPRLRCRIPIACQASPACRVPLH